MKPIVLSVEVSEPGLRAARNKAQEFLSHVSTQTDEAAALAYVVFRKIVREMDRTVKREEKASVKRARKRRPKPPTVLERRRRIAA